MAAARPDRVHSESDSGSRRSFAEPPPDAAAAAAAAGPALPDPFAKVCEAAGGAGPGAGGGAAAKGWRVCGGWVSVGRGGLCQCRL